MNARQKSIRVKRLRDFPVTLIGDPGHAAAQRKTVARLTRRRGRQRMRRNVSETVAWQSVKRIARGLLQGSSPALILRDGNDLAGLANIMLAQLKSGVHENRARRNPLLGIFGPNPKAKVVKELGRVVQVRYKRKDDGKLYYHPTTSRPRLLALSDGTIWIKP